MASSYYARVTAKIPATLAAHPSWTTEDARRFLRGHGAPREGITPEHGKLSHPHIRAAGKAPPGPLAIGETYRDAVLIRDVNRAAANSERVAINVHTKAGGYQTIGQSHRGFSASYVAQRIADHNGDVRAAVAELIAENRRGRSSDPVDLGDHASAEDYAGAIDKWQVVSYRE